MSLDSTATLAEVCAIGYDDGVASTRTPSVTDEIITKTAQREAQRRSAT